MEIEKSRISAFLDALRGKDISYYPREGGRQIPPNEAIERISAQLKSLDDLKSDDEKQVQRAKDSLEEVKKLTEYQDQKVARLLTIIAFLTAAAGAIFSKIIDVYPLHENLSRENITTSLIVLLVYGLFGAYLILVAAGALVTFHATQTRFVWEKGESDEVKSDRVRSRLFFRSILTTSPEAWANGFLDKADAKSTSKEIFSAYFKNYIIEAYLVAFKIGDKLRYLQPAQGILLLAIRVLFFWLIFLILAFAVLPTAKASLQEATTKGSNASNAPPNFDFNLSTQPTKIEVSPIPVKVEIVSTPIKIETATQCTLVHPKVSKPSFDRPKQSNQRPQCESK